MVKRLVVTKPDNAFNYTIEEDPWKTSYLRQPGNHLLCDVPSTFLDDQFNLYGLDEQFSMFKTHLSIIQGNYSPSSVSRTRNSDILSCLPVVYCAIHSRYVQTPDGIKQVNQKYLKGDFGCCPRIKCKGEHLIPYGASQVYGRAPLQFLCPQCMEIYNRPACSKMPKAVIPIDGSHYGPNFPMIFIDDCHLISKRYKCKPFQLEAFGFRVKQTWDNKTC